MARSYSAKEAFTVQARTYPKVWADATRASIAAAEKRTKVGFTEEMALEKYGINDAPTMAPFSFVGAKYNADKAIDNIYKILKDELPASVFKPYDTKVEFSKGSYRVMAAFQSPSGNTDYREVASVYTVSGEEETKQKLTARAIEQLIVENGAEHREIKDGKQTRIEARRQSDRG